MKIVKAEGLNKARLKISKTEWESMGKRAGWLDPISEREAEEKALRHERTHNPVADDVKESLMPETPEKAVRLSPSEIANADARYGSGREYTIVRRPQSDGKYWIAAINVSDGSIVTEEYAENKEDVRRAIKEVNRWMDKAYGGGPMAWKSRRRPKS